ncbi:Transcription initiation factor TFIID subunit 10 [Mortierella antarctica]|nr:Transcription initiation factor TFIID subunit 10 [Mortierella antarctica]
MSDGSNSSHSTVEDATMASPQPSLHSGTSTPAQIRSEADNLTTATPMDQDTPSSNQTPTQAPTSTIASPAGANSEQQQQAASPSSSAPMTPSYASTPITAASLASTSMTGVVSTSTPPASFSTSDVGASSAASTTTPLPSKGSEMPGVQTQSSTSSVQPLSQQQQQQQQQQQHHLQLLQKQAQEQAHLAQLQQAQATATASVAQHNLAVGAALQSRKEEELNRKDRTLAEFLPMMESYNPIIPDAVTDYYLSRTGFDCDDVRIKRLLALAAQKFVSDIATDAFQYCKVRQQSQKRTPGKEKKTVLTMEDLSDALGEYGINVKKPDYFM